MRVKQPKSKKLWENNGQKQHKSSSLAHEINYSQKLVHLFFTSVHVTVVKKESL